MSQPNILKSISKRMLHSVQAMFSLHLSYHWIRWTRSTTLPPILPEGVERLFLNTPGGLLEILYASADDSSTGNAAPLFFVHGGMGGAWVWLEYLQFFSSQGIPCYAISLRGHGESWHPSFLRMVYGTTKRALADDLVAGVKWVEEREKSQVVLVGHSSGGGLSQFVLSEKDIKVRALVLAAAVPGFGSYGVYFNWWRLDPLFTMRMILHGWHPNSPLSHPALTQRAFFSYLIPDSYLLQFQERMNAYESFWWPIGMMRPFVNSESVLQQITGWGSGERVLVLAGGGDNLMRVPIMKRLAAFYRTAYVQLVGEKRIEAGEDDDVKKTAGRLRLDDAGQGTRFSVVPVAGHHLQNDVQWEDGAKRLLDFYNQL